MRAFTILAFLTLPFGCLQAQVRTRTPTTPAATTVQVTLAAPATKIVVGSPIVLEMTVTTSGPWSGTASTTWERRAADGSWTAFVDKSPGDSHPFEVVNARTQCRALRQPVTVLWNLTPGTWRVRSGVHWRDDTKQSRAAETEWREIEIVEHAGNRAAMRDTSNRLLSTWQLVVSGKPLGEDVAIPPQLKGKGLLPQGTPMADMAARIAALRDSGVSSELALAADLILLRRDLRRIRSIPAGAARTAATEALRARLDALAKANPLAATPLGGQPGRIVHLLANVLRLDDPKGDQQLVADVAKTNPQLADLLATDLTW